MTALTDVQAVPRGDHEVPNLWELAQHWNESTSGVSYGRFTLGGGQVEMNVWSTWQAVGVTAHNPSTDRYERWLEFLVEVNVQAPADIPVKTSGDLDVMPLAGVTIQNVVPGYWKLFDSKPDTYQGETTITKSETVSWGAGTELGFDGSGKVSGQYGASMGTSVSWGIPDLVYLKQAGPSNPGWHLSVSFNDKADDPPPVSLGTLSQSFAWIWQRPYASREEALADVSLDVIHVVTPSYLFGTGFTPVMSTVRYHLPPLPASSG